MIPSARFGGMAFVMGVRVLWLLVAAGLSFPMLVVKRWLPSTPSVRFERLARLRAWMAKQTIGRLPAWVDYQGSGLFLLTTTAGMGRLDALVDRLPARTADRWERFGIRTMEVFIVIWGAILLAYLAVVGWALGRTVHAIRQWAATVEWGAVGKPGAMPGSGMAPSSDAILAAVPELVLGVALLVAVWWGIMLFFLPGLVLHEFGHYAALRKAGASVDGYGLLLFGPVLGGAFVKPGRDAVLLDQDETFSVWSAGIANSVLWGTILIAAGVSLGGLPVDLFAAYLSGEMQLVGLAAQPIPSIVVALGVAELANGFLNAAPLGPVDGGGFIRSFEREWWGFDRAIDDALRRGA